MNSSYTVNRKKWAQLNIFNQMGNIYSEVGRTFNSTGADRQQAIARAIDLFDATAESLAKIKSPKLKEVLRVKEEYLRIACNSRPSPADRQSLDKYFLQFAIAARR